jgi:hypothetical protein
MRFIFFCFCFFLISSANRKKRKGKNEKVVHMSNVGKRSWQHKVIDMNQILVYTRSLTAIEEFSFLKVFV